MNGDEGWTFFESSTSRLLLRSPIVLTAKPSIDRISNLQVHIPLVLKMLYSFSFCSAFNSMFKVARWTMWVTSLAYFCITESPSPSTPGLSYFPLTMDSSSKTCTVQMMFEGWSSVFSVPTTIHTYSSTAHLRANSAFALIPPSPPIHRERERRRLRKE